MNVESIKSELVRIVGNITYVHTVIDNIADKLRKSELEIKKLNSIIDQLRDERDMLKAENERLKKGGEA